MRIYICIFKGFEGLLTELIDKGDPIRDNRFNLEDPAFEL